jgi:hypothetical protein
VNIGDEDGLLIATPDDLYIVSQGAEMGTVQQSKVYTKTIYGEFPGATAQVSGGGATLNLQRTPTGQFNRFERKFYIIDNYPMEGAISPVPDAPVMVQKPGDIGTWTAPAASPVKVYAEGVSVISDGSPTHNLIPGEIAPSSFTLEADVDANRIQTGPQAFILRLYTADGAAIGTGDIPIPAQDAGTIFDGLGEKYTGATVQIVSNLTGDVRSSADAYGNVTIVLHAGEFVEANFAGLSTLAGALIKVNLDGDCNLNKNYADDELTEKTAPGLLVPQTDDGSASWQGNLVKVHLTGVPKGINVGSVTLTVTNNPNGGQIKVWSTNNLATAALWIDTTNGLTSQTWNLSTSASMGNLPEWLYVGA